MNKIQLPNPKSQIQNPKSKIQNRIVLAICWVVLNSIQVQAQPLNFGQNSVNKSLIFAAPPPPPDLGEPGRRAEAGSRGCGDDKLNSIPSKQLTALVPVYSNSELVLGLTTLEHPTFWFYVPYQPAKSGQFVLRDKAGKLIHQSDVTVSKIPGVVSFTLPSNVPPLEIGKQYRWYFKIFCRKQQAPAFVDGWIQRNPLDPALKSQLEKATPQQRVTLYAKNGIWFDALSSAAVLHRTNPQDISWTRLLQAVGLNDLANEQL